MSTEQHSNHQPTAKEVKFSYHPKGYGVSPSLKRARKPFILTNILIGGSLFAFAVGVYVYSISAVKQDDFSDVADLLPPLEERKKFTSIEDEQRSSSSSAISSLQSLASPLPLSAPTRSTPIPSGTSTGSSSSKLLPGQDLNASTAPASVSTSTSTWGVKRLSEVDWLKKKGWVDARGNILVWGAPDVERIGRMGETTSKRLV